MNSSTATHKAKKPRKPRKQKENKTIVINQLLDIDIYDRAKKYVNDNGLMSVQNAIRIALAAMLTNKGY